MERDIINFLPKYPNIKKLKGEVFNPYEEDFYQVIYKKKEFYDERLEETEDFPKNVGTLMKHQKLIARFFGSHTLYDELMLVHEMGTGKTCSAIGAIEQIRGEGGFRGALYLAKGDALINNFINELVFKCTDGRYIPENYDELTELEKVHRTKKVIREYYKLNTFETFAKEIRRTTDTELQKKYNNHIIIVDEVHNLRIQAKEKGLNIYKQFLRFLHIVQNCKILLMSGTPMKDSVDELASVMNLILPLRGVNPYLPTGDVFIKEYFDGSDEYYTVKPGKIKDLKELFKGRISYLKAMQSEVKKVFEGDHHGDLQHLHVVHDYMSKFQTQSYKEAYKSDRAERKGVYSQSRQASLFVYPDGSYGEAGYNNYIQKISKANAVIGDDGKKKKMYNYTIQSELRNAITKNTDGDHKKMLENIERFSGKYAASIRNILRAQEEGKSVFVYNEFVQGSGLILFGAILELFGFNRASGKEPTGSQRPRYASLTNLTSTNKQVRGLIKRFNQPDNMHGKIIGVIMGSRKIAEGFSLQNVQVEEIHTPWFNYSETAQAIARGYRLGSHRMLIESGVTPVVSIYQRVSIPIGDYKSIDLDMYEISETKDLSIKRVERLMKEAAWDCALTYDRNHVTGREDERECDYMECDYVCDGIPADMIDADISNTDLDYSTYQIYYSHPNVRKIMNELVLLFRDNFRMDLHSITNHFPEYSGFELITALRTIINESVQITNKYGFPSYIKEENNIFFLVDSLSVSGRFSSDYYTEFPHVKKPTTFANVVQPLYYKSLPEIVSESYRVSNIEDVRKMMIRLPLEVQEIFIEGSISAIKQGVTHNTNARALIMEYFENSYTEIDNIWVSWLLYDEQEIMRCLKDDNWQNCTEDYVEKVEEHRKQIQIGLEQNEYGYYGQYNPETKQFCIRDVSQPITVKKHKRTSGKVCNTLTKTELADLAINTLNIPLPSDADMIRDVQKKWSGVKNKLGNLWKDLAKKNHMKDILAAKKKKEMSTDEIRRVLFWGTLKKPQICKFIHDWFEDKKLLVEDKGCGRGDKKKI